MLTPPSDPDTALLHPKAQFSKAVQATQPRRDAGKDAAAALVAADKTASALDAEIEALLAQLTHALDSMQRAAPTASSSASAAAGGGSSSSAAEYTVQRSRQVAFDYAQDFRKSKNVLVANRQRAALLGDGRDRAALRPRTEMLLKEKDSIEASMRIADEAIESAQASRTSLAAQRDIFANVSNRMAAIAERLPLIGGLLGKISGARRKDMLVMACVITSCLVFTFLYIVYVKLGL